MEQTIDFLIMSLAMSASAFILCTSIAAAPDTAKSAQKRAIVMTFFVISALTLAIVFFAAMSSDDLAKKIIGPFFTYLLVMSGALFAFKIKASKNDT